MTKEYNDNYWWNMRLWRYRLKFGIVGHVLAADPDKSVAAVRQETPAQAVTVSARCSTSSRSKLQRVEDN